MVRRRNSSPLLLTLDYPPNDGGISRLALGLSEALDRMRKEPRVVTFAAGGRLGLARPALPIVEVVNQKGLRDLQIMRGVRAQLRGYGYDAPILATVWNPEATLAMFAGATRVSILAHGNEVMPYGGLRSRLRRWVLTRAHRVICNSRFTEGLVRDIAPGARTAVLNPAVDAARFQSGMDQAEARLRLEIPPTARLLLTVARLDPIKGHETVLRALAKLAPEKRVNMIYAIIGKGEMLASLQATAQDMGIAGHVRFLGFVPDDKLPLWYAAADLFLLCSVVDMNRRAMEGFGMALTEAQAAGLAVIGSRSGGIPDAVREGEGGWLIAERDAAGLAAHLVRLAENPEIFATQGRLGAERVRREMGWDSYAQRMLELI